MEGQDYQAENRSTEQRAKPRITEPWFDMVRAIGRATFIKYVGSKRIKSCWSLCASKSGMFVFQVLSRGFNCCWRLFKKMSLGT